VGTVFSSNRGKGVRLAKRGQGGDRKTVVKVVG